MEKHKITTDVVVDCIFNNVLASSSSERKRLLINVTIDVFTGKINAVYKVETPARTHYLGYVLSDAVEAYNNN